MQRVPNFLFKCVLIGLLSKLDSILNPRHLSIFKKKLIFLQNENTFSFCLFLLSISFLFSNDQRPNVLFIMSDDHTSQAIGHIKADSQNSNPTPTIDRLAKEGMLFENAFCSNSICAPSRATILTGNTLTLARSMISKEALNLGVNSLPLKWEKPVIKRQ